MTTQIAATRVPLQSPVDAEKSPTSSAVHQDYAGADVYRPPPSWLGGLQIQPAGSHYAAPPPPLVAQRSLVRSDSLAELARAMAAAGPAHAYFHNGNVAWPQLAGPIQKAMARMGEMKLARKNRDGWTGSYSRRLPKQYELRMDREARAKEAKIVQIQDPRERQKAWARMAAEVYRNADGWVAHCGESRDIFESMLIEDGVPADWLLPLSMTGKTHTGVPVDHCFLACRPGGIPAGATGTAQDLKTLLTPLNEWVFVDPWRNSKLYVPDRAAGPGDFIDFCLAGLKDADDQLNVATFQISESTA